MSAEPNPVLVTEEAAELLRLSKQKILAMRKQGRIHGVKDGKSYTFLRSELLATLERPKQVMEQPAQAGRRRRTRA